MDVFYATFRLTRQTRRIEVIDVGHLCVEYVEGFKDETSLAREAVPNLAIPQRRTVRRHARILDQCPRTKMANSDTAEQSLFGLERQSGRDDAIERPWNPRPRRIVVGEARTRKCQIGVERKPRLETRIVRPLNANSSTRTTRLCRPGIANEQQFRVDAQIPESHGRLNATKADGAEANLGTLCANERCHAIGRLSGRRINGDCSAARVVAVETCSGIHVDFGAAPRAEDCPDLRTHEAVRAIA